MPELKTREIPKDLITVQDLISHLQTLPPTFFVMVSGYEGGILGLKKEFIHEGFALCYKNDYSGFYGPHEFHSSALDAINEKIYARDFMEDDLPVVACILIGRSES